MGKKGLSLDEKREIALAYFMESATFHHLRELEKVLAKRGVASMSIKDVIQGLVDDDLVSCERVGASNMYWAFPSKVSQKRKRMDEDLDEKIEAKRQKIKQLETERVTLTVGREETDERAKLIEVVTELREKREKLDAELLLYKENDPELFKELQQDVTTARDAVNRWTDNLFSIQSYIVNKYNLDGRELFKNFGISNDLDYVE